MVFHRQKDGDAAEWYWYHYEYAVVKPAVHRHDLPKLKDNPGLCNLAEKVSAAKQLSEELNKNIASPAKKEITTLREGNNSEKNICYCDKLI